MKLSVLLMKLFRYWAPAIALAGSLAAQSNYILQTTTAADASRITSQYALTIVNSVHDDDNIYLVSLPSGTTTQTVQAIQSDPAVLEFTPDSVIDSGNNQAASLYATALDPLQDALVSHSTVSYFGAPVRSGYVDQNATSLIRLAQTQQQFPTGNSVVAVIDTGVDPNHPALGGVLVPGFDFIHNIAGIPSELSDLDQSTVAILDQSTVAILDTKNTPLVLDQSTVAILDQSTVAILDGIKLPHDFGHGTMVSGLIHLVAPTAQIMPLKAFQADGTANLSDVIRAIYYAVDHGAKVINMSFSISIRSAALLQAIQYATNLGVISVAAAGNEGKHMKVYPAGYQGVVGVGSTNKHDLVSLFSNWGEESAARLAAPGEALVTTYPGNNYAAVWGTSFSTPLVAGAAALVLNYAPAATFQQLNQVLNQGNPIGGSDDVTRLNVLSTMLSCAGTPYASGTDN